MALLLAPYTSAMRLGQGRTSFNSYTQEIILNDVVTIDPSRESFVTNDGCTMKQQRASMYKHEARPNSGPVVVPAAMQKSKMSSESSKKMTSSATKPVERAIDVYYDGLVEHGRDQSQTVDYNARLVEKISEVTENMNISGGFAIKCGKVGGSLQGGYINTEKFAESDINFYISVKVVNRSINIQDATVFQPIDESVKEMTSEQFTKIYGDCFISGFEEGGEFHAIVSIKARDKSHTKEITAK